MTVTTRSLTLTALFAALLSVSAYIRIPFFLVPLTLQSPVVLITGWCLGPRYGPTATLLYTAIGLAGLPVFASGGGPAYVLSPTFGYIVGFTVCAFVTGLFAQLTRRESPFAAYFLMLAGLGGLYLPGLLWLGLAMRWIAPVSSDIMTVLRAGFLIPFAGDILTTIPAAIVAVRVRKSMRRTV